jgi:hypothetical protein
MNEELKPPDLAASQATLTAEVQIIRAGTGKVENYTLTIAPDPEQPEPEGEA